MQLGAQRRAARNDRAPSPRIPARLRSEADGPARAVATQYLLEALPCPEVAHAVALALRGHRELARDITQSLCRADGRTRDHAHAIPAHIADHRIAARREPERDPRIENLIRGGIPPMAQHELARSLGVFSAHSRSIIDAKLSLCSPMTPVQQKLPARALLTQWTISPLPAQISRSRPRHSRADSTRSLP